MAALAALTPTCSRPWARPGTGGSTSSRTRLAAAARGDGSYVQQQRGEQGQQGGGGGGNGGRPPRVSFRTPRKGTSSWSAKEAGGGRSAESDYLSEVGSSQMYNINVDHGQNSSMIDSLFTGNVLGHKSDIADGSLQQYEFRTYNNIVGDYYVAPRFLEKVALHIAKNVLVDAGAFDAQTRVPLILGIWGGKGQGKTFQTELCFKQLGVEPIIMSAGELEHEWAGTPGKLIRDRYRRAAELIKVRGKLSCLMINDIDAGIGHFENTQLTVNNQIVGSTLMNLCDSPNSVSDGGDWRADEHLKRVPIILTGNDMSSIYAPLIRDGRMDKYYWQPTEEDLMYRDDGLSTDDMLALLRTFPNQPLDFFGALRAAQYDNQIREWIKHDVVKGDIAEDNENMKELGRRLVKQEGLPKFEPIDLTLGMLLAEGDRLVQEQEFVNTIQLSGEYLKKQQNSGRSLIGMQG